jgi:hypothetical protein
LNWINGALLPDSPETPASDDLVKLIGRPATTAHEAVQNAATTGESR